MFSACDTEEKTIVIPIGGGGETQHAAGDQAEYSADDVSFMMLYVPGGTFPTDVDDTGDMRTVADAFWMAETEVTYELWYRVIQWATTDAGGGVRADGGPLYAIVYPGREGHDGTDGAEPMAAYPEPVAGVSWRGVMVWCNALTEFYNAHNGSKPDLDCVYYTDSGYQAPLRTATTVTAVTLVSGQEDQPYVKTSVSGNTNIANNTALGFRLPTSGEWECAARYIDGTTWTAGDHASGADTAYDVTTGGADTDGDGDIDYTGNVAVFGVSGTVQVKTRHPNALGLFDMSGSVLEWCFDWDPDYMWDMRVVRGGSWNDGDWEMQIGFSGSVDPFEASEFLGFRIARTR